MEPGRHLAKLAQPPRLYPSFHRLLSHLQGARPCLSRRNLSCWKTGRHQPQSTLSAWRIRATLTRETASTPYSDMTRIPPPPTQQVQATGLAQASPPSI